jgi:hypothetical protein
MVDLADAGFRAEVPAVVVGEGGLGGPGGNVPGPGVLAAAAGDSDLGEEGAHDLGGVRPHEDHIRFVAAEAAAQAVFRSAGTDEGARADV